MSPVSRILMSLMDGVALDASLPELLCLDARSRLPVSAAALTLSVGPDTLEPVATSGGRARELQSLQFSLGEGPCHDALRTGRLLQVAHLATDEAARWPAYAPRAIGLGVRSLVSLPLLIGGIRLGVLDLFREVPGGLVDDDLRVAMHYVDAAVLILLHLQESATPATTATSWLDHAFTESLHGHPEVHQATGMVSVQAAVGLAEALVLLRAHAFAESRSLVDVARDVVRRLVSFD